MSTLKTNRIENLTTTDGGISIDNGGRVGLGTSTPGSFSSSTNNLVVSETGGNSGITLHTGTSNSSFLGFTDTGDTNNQGYIGYSHSDNALLFAANSAERLRIDSSGKLLVGTTSNYAENVQAAFYGASNGGIALASGTSGLSRLMFADATAGNVGAYVGSIIYSHADDSLRFNVNGGTERARIDSSGRLLINNSSASQNHPLQVTAASDATALVINGRAADDIGEIGFYENDRTTNLGEIQYRQDHVNFRHRVGDIRFATGGTTERMRIDSSGNLGVGTTSPSQKLHVSGQALFNNGSNFYVNSASAATVLDAKSGVLRFDMNGTERVRFQSGGGVSIGTTSSPNCLTQTSALRLNQNTVGSHTLTNISTTVTNISASSGIGGLAFVQLYNTANGAQYVGIVMWRHGVVSVVSESNATGLAINFSVSGSTLRLATGSGTVSGSVITLQG